MTRPVQTNKLIVWLGVMSIILISLILAFLLLKRGHVWGDDFAGYLLQTEALLQGNPYDLWLQNKWMNERSVIAPGPDAYPWGYPMLLLPAYIFWGIHPLALKSVNLLFYAAALFFMALILYHYDRSFRSIVWLASFAFLPAILDQSDYINSDLAFLAVTMVCLWLVSVWPTIDPGKAIIFGVVIFSATFIRTTGVVLWVLFINQYMREVYLQKNWKVFIAAVGSFLLPFLVQSVILPQGNSSYFTHFKLFTAQNLYQNLLYYLSLPGFAFSQIPAQSVVYLSFLVLAAFGWKERRRTFDSYLFFVFFMLAGTILWPERQGLRFVLPILPVLWVMAAAGQRVLEGNRWAVGKAVTWVMALVTLYALYISSSNAVNNIRNQRSINGPFDMYSAEMFEYIKANATPQDAIVFFKPRAMRLMADVTHAFAARDCDSLAGASLVVINLKQDSELQLTPDGFKACSVSLHSDQVFENRRFQIYRIHRQ